MVIASVVRARSAADVLIAASVLSVLRHRRRRRLSRWTMTSLTRSLMATTRVAKRLPPSSRLRALRLRRVIGLRVSAVDADVADAVRAVVRLRMHLRVAATANHSVIS